MTSDNRTTELLPCPFCGGEARLISSAPDWYFPACMNRECACDWTDSYPTKAEAIHAWNARATHGTLTAEQVRHASHGHYKLRMVRDVDGFDVPQVTFDWQAIADELNAELGSGTCEWLLEHSGTLYDKWRCSECKFLFVEPRCDQGYTDLVPNFCPNCGKAVKR